MARAPVKGSWMKAAKTKADLGNVRTAKPGKSPRTKLLEGIDKQIANLADQTLDPRASWVKAVGTGFALKVRYGTAPLFDEPIYLLAGDVKPALEGFRKEVEAGHYDEELAALSEKMAAGRRKD